MEDRSSTGCRAFGFKVKQKEKFETRSLLLARKALARWLSGNASLSERHRNQSPSSSVVLLHFTTRWKYHAQRLGKNNNTKANIQQQQQNKQTKTKITDITVYILKQKNEIGWTYSENESQRRDQTLHRMATQDREKRKIKQRMTG